MNVACRRKQPPTPDRTTRPEPGGRGGGADETTALHLLLVLGGLAKLLPTNQGIPLGTCQPSSLLVLPILGLAATQRPSLDVPVGSHPSHPPAAPHRVCTIHTYVSKGSLHSTSPRVAQPPNE